jgi:hypothetical protein
MFFNVKESCAYSSHHYLKFDKISFHILSKIRKINYVLIDLNEISFKQRRGYSFRSSHRYGRLDLSGERSGQGEGHLNR